MLDSASIHVLQILPPENNNNYNYNKLSSMLVQDQKGGVGGVPVCLVSKHSAT